MERTINNGLPLYQLTKQFRMRPEIMSLVLPFITNHLESSEHTYNLPNVIGISKNVYFIDHNIIEVNYYVINQNVCLIKMFKPTRNAMVKFISIYMK
jgi:superfamily I DNA and/or RNA helicase